MADHLDRLSKVIRRRIGRAQIGMPTAAVLSRLLEIAYLASLRTEEGRSVRGSLTYADPTAPDPDPPIIRRADFPAFNSFAQPIGLTAESLIKLARAVDPWSGSIAVYSGPDSDLKAWGIVDQLVHLHMRMNREGSKGGDYPGVLTIVIEGTADLSVYHGGVFLGALRQDRIVENQPDALRSRPIRRRVEKSFQQFAGRLHTSVGAGQSKTEFANDLLRTWSSTVARLCIGLRRLGTGGAFVMSAKPRMDLLQFKYQLHYERLTSAVILGVQDSSYAASLEEDIYSAEVLEREAVIDHELARADADDRELELSGAVRVVTSLAAVDGVVVLRLPMDVVGFGAKIMASGKIGVVYDGAQFSDRGVEASQVDYNRFGTRHASVLRYCAADQSAIGVIVSQDGVVRVVATASRNLLLWDDVKLMDYQDDLQTYIRNERRSRKSRDAMRDRTRMGYTDLPKTLSDLLRVEDATNEAV